MPNSLKNLGKFLVQMAILDLVELRMDGTDPAVIITARPQVADVEQPIHQKHALR
jgi:hypothetical protein